MEERELYVYTTPHYKKRGYLKIGDTLAGRYLQRINEQFGTSNPEQAIICWVVPLPTGIRDHHIHQQLLTNGIEKVEQSSGREWFVTDLHQVKKAYNKVCFGSSREHAFELRKEQADAVAKAVNWFNGHHPTEELEGASHPDRFLLNAKMRFGKCFTGIHTAKALNAQRCLIVTYKPEVISEWLDVVNNHIHFEGWIGLRGRRNEADINEPYLDDHGTFPLTQESLVVCASLQDLTVDADGKTKKRLANVMTEAWDLVIFDEVHFGSQTERAKYLLDKLRWKKRLDLSGTPFRLIQEEDFPPTKYSPTAISMNSVIKPGNSPK